jgi:hypothetical protein
MTWHVERIAEHWRWIPSGQAGFDAHEPFCVGVVVQWLGPGRVFLSGMRGKMTRVQRLRIESDLIAAGATEASALRRGRMIVWSLSDSGRVIRRTMQT